MRAKSPLRFKPPTVYLQIKCPDLFPEYITCCCLGNWFGTLHLAADLSTVPAESDTNLKARVPLEKLENMLLLPSVVYG